MLPCRPNVEEQEHFKPGKKVLSYDALPRESKFVYMPPSFYATGFRVFPVYKTEVDVSDSKGLYFLGDPKLNHLWGALRATVPFAEKRVIDLPGSRELHYRGYGCRGLTPETTASWRKSIASEGNRFADSPPGAKLPDGVKFDCNYSDCKFKAE